MLTSNFTFIFDSKSDYKKQMDEYTDYIMKIWIEDRQERNVVVQHLIDSYIEAIGERPSHKVLSKLSNYLLLEELKDPNPYKVAKNEYPVLSMNQIRRRTNNEVGLEIAEENIGTNGKSLSEAGRRKLNTYEIMAKDGDFKHLSQQDRFVHHDEKRVKYHIDEERLNKVNKHPYYKPNNPFKKDE